MGFLKSTQSNPKTIDTFQNIMSQLGFAHEEVLSKLLYKITKFKSISSPVQLSLLDPQTLLQSLRTNKQERQRDRDRGNCDWNQGIRRSPPLILGYLNQGNSFGIKHLIIAALFVVSLWDIKRKESLWGFEEGLFLMVSLDSLTQCPLAYAWPDGSDSWQPIQLLKNTAVLNLSNLTQLQFILG